MKPRNWLPIAAMLVTVGSPALCAEDPWTPADLLQPSELAARLATKEQSKPEILFVGFPVLYRAAHIPGAALAGPCSKAEGLDLLKKTVADQPRDRELVIYCGCCPFVKCPNVRPAFRALHEMGFSRVKVLVIENNFHADWVAKGYPVEKAAEAVHVEAQRISQESLLGPGKTWTELGLFNPTAIRVGSKTVLLFRAQDRAHTSRIGYAESEDGVHFVARHEPVLSPVANYERRGGVEDPRVVEIGGIYYLTYTGYDGRAAQLCLATSSDLMHWNRKGVILPAYKGTWNTQWTKSGAILPEKVNGKWWMYYLGTRTDADGQPRDYMGLAVSDDLLHWKDATNQPVLERRPGAFDSRVMEPGPAPILTDAGILLLYNGADDHLVYGPGWVLFDRQDPRRVIARADGPFVVPTLPWEKVGNVPNVIFLEGAVTQMAARDRLQLTGYYGAADKFVGGLNIRLTLPR
ncbi:MAG TPA: family 43 glycosylhydrolase [Bryobacteraceae bacterium]